MTSSTSINYRLIAHTRPPLFPRLVADVSVHLLTYNSISDLGSLSAVSIGVWYFVNQPMIWMTREQSETVLNNYPAGTPLKRIVAATHFEKKRPWRGERDDAILRTARNQMSLCQRMVIRRSEQYHHYKKRKEIVKKRLKRHFDVLYKTPLTNNSWRLKKRRVCRMLERCSVVRSQIQYFHQQRSHYSWRHQQATATVKKLEERLRRHDAFTSYLHYHWYFSNLYK